MTAHVRVRSLVDIGRIRAGRVWSVEWTYADVSESELAKLMADEWLVVDVITPLGAADEGPDSGDNDIEPKPRKRR